MNEVLKELQMALSEHTARLRKFHTRSADLPRRVNKTLLGFAPLWIDVRGRRELANKDRQLCRVHFYTDLFCNIAPLPGCLTRIGIRCQNAQVIAREQCYGRVSIAAYDLLSVGLAGRVIA